MVTATTYPGGNYQRGPDLNLYKETTSLLRTRGRPLQRRDHSVSPMAPYLGLSFLSLCRSRLGDLQEQATRKDTQLPMQGRLFRSALVPLAWIREVLLFKPYFDFVDHDRVLTTIVSLSAASCILEAMLLGFSPIDFADR